MGWTGTHKQPGQTMLDFFCKELNYDGETTKGRVYACKTYKRSVSYLAYEITGKEKETREVFGIVCLLRFSTGYYNITYKDMPESTGPFYYDCPKSILSLLTPLPKGDTSYAAKWREKCWERINKCVK